MLPPTLPLFPLPNAVLFPGVYLPLHVFEPRYREMVRDALDDDRIIGMTLLKPGFEAEYEARPPIYTIGCAGLITHAEPLADGRFNIVLQGLERFRVHRRGSVTAVSRRAHRAARRLRLTGGSDDGPGAATPPRDADRADDRACRRRALRSRPRWATPI